jgi:hypothetical protein
VNGDACAVVRADCVTGAGIGVGAGFGGSAFATTLLVVVGLLAGCGGGAAGRGAGLASATTAGVVGHYPMRTRSSSGAAATGVDSGERPRAPPRCTPGQRPAAPSLRAACTSQP